MATMLLLSACGLSWAMLGTYTRYTWPGLWLSCLGMLVSVVAFGMMTFRFRPVEPKGFSATVRHRNIALDHGGGRLWVRALDGGERTLSRKDIRAWRHEWTRCVNLLGAERCLHNHIVLILDDPQDTRLSVDFGSDHRAAREWKARLHYWMC